MRNILLLVILMLVAQLSFTLSLKDHKQSFSEFCWKDSVGRGVGTIPTGCAEGREKIGLLCYTNCPAGYSRSGFDCHQKCPDEPGWENQLLFCRYAEYGRSAGYPWQIGDPFNDSGMFRRC